MLTGIEWTTFGRGGRTSSIPKTPTRSGIGNATPTKSSAEETKFTVETSIESAMEESLSESFLEDIDITITEWEKTKVDGYKAFVYSYEFESGGIGYEQMQVAINGKDYIHYVTFTDYAGTSYKDEFYTCIKNMRFE